MVRLAALMSLRSHLIAGVSFGPYTESEYTYAADLWPCVPDDSLTVVDRGFFAAAVLIPLTREGKNRHFLIRAKKNNYQRWEIELGYDEIKTELLDREEAIRSLTVTGVWQELWGILLAYNLVRLEMERIAEEAGVEPVRVSFVTALRYIRDEWFWLCGTRTPGAIPRHLRAMRESVKRFILPPRRSERVYPRAVKIKMSNYPLNRRRKER
jgi:hypothetical protein